jgi:ubiquinone/menaquinone biosynthesis C-methylase UbiE
MKIMENSMKKFTDKINESKEDFDSKELKMGIKVESEHNDVYEYLQEKFKDIPLTKTEFYEKIAKAHLREIPDYYSRLKIMEKE